MYTRTTEKKPTDPAPSTHQIRAYSTEPAKRLTPKQIEKLREQASNEVARHPRPQSAFARSEESADVYM